MPRSSNGEARPESILAAASGIGNVSPKASFWRFAFGFVGLSSAAAGAGVWFMNWAKAEGDLCAAVELRARMRPGRPAA